MSTENLLNALSNCQCFIYISSSSVYDFSDGKSKKETDFGHAYKLSLYGKSKLRAEELVMRSDIASIYILRPRAVYGKGDRVLLPRILHQIKGNKMFVPGDLNVQTSLTHIDNLSEAIKLCIQKQLPGVSIYNVSDNKTYNLRAIFGAILKAKTGKGKMIHIPVSIIKTIINIQRIVGQRSNITNQSLNYLCQNSVIDNSKIYNELGYRGTKNFFESLPEIL
jgi:nucleoside-diphosphate-sugar epimerase